MYAYHNLMTMGGDNHFGLHTPKKENALCKEQRWKFYVYYKDNQTGK